MGAVKRSRIPAVVLTANGDVHTHEEAQVFVHDLNQFVTVQLLEETPAVLSLGKLCEDHGYPYDWVSGQEPRLTKNGKSIICKTDNFVPLVVPGFSTNSESVSAPTSPSQDSLRRGAETAAGNSMRLASSSSSGSDLERNDENSWSRRTDRKLCIQKTRWRWTHIPSCRWYRKIFRKRLRIPSTHSKAGKNRKEWRSQRRTSRRIGRASTDRIHRRRWSPCRFLVDPRWFHLSSSQWASSSTQRAKGRNVPCSTEMHWCCQVYWYWSGCVTRETDWRLLECRFEQTLVRFLERIHKVFSVNLQRDICGPEGDWQRFKRLPDQIMYGQKFGRKLVRAPRIEKSNSVQKKNQSSTVLEKTKRNLLYRTRWRRIQRNPQKTRGEIRQDPWCHAA